MDLSPFPSPRDLWLTRSVFVRILASYLLRDMEKPPKMSQRLQSPATEEVRCSQYSTSPGCLPLGLEETSHLDTSPRHNSESSTLAA